MIINYMDHVSAANPIAYQTLESSTFDRHSSADLSLNHGMWIVYTGNFSSDELIVPTRQALSKKKLYAIAGSLSNSVNNVSVSREIDYYVVNVTEQHDSFEQENLKVTHEANKHLSNLYAFDENKNSEALNYLYEVIETAFSSRDLLLVDYLLANIDLTKTRQVVYVGLLRGTYRARKQLSYWSKLRTKVSEHLKGEGKNKDWILRGLLKPDDRYTLTSESRA